MDWVKDGLIAVATFGLGLLSQYLIERRKDKKAELKAIEEQAEKLISSAESDSVYIVKFHLNELRRKAYQFCQTHKVKADIESDLSALSIACTFENLDKAKATDASINLLNKIKNAV